MGTGTRRNFLASPPSAQARVRLPGRAKYSNAISLHPIKSSLTSISPRRAAPRNRYLASRTRAIILNNVPTARSAVASENSTVTNVSASSRRAKRCSLENYEFRMNSTVRSAIYLTSFFQSLALPFLLSKLSGFAQKMAASLRGEPRA